MEGVGAGEFLRLAQVASRYEKVRRVIAAFLDEGEDLGFLGFAESADGAVLPNECVEISWLLGITVELQSGIARFFGELAIKTDKERKFRIESPFVIFAEVGGREAVSDHVFCSIGQLHRA